MNKGSGLWTSSSPQCHSLGYEHSYDYSCFGLTPSEWTSEVPLRPSHIVQPLAHHQLPTLNMPRRSQPTKPLILPNYLSPQGRVIRAPLDAGSRLPAKVTKRKKLTTETKRVMCQMDKMYPGIPQADIATRFGVDRSTVSKVLRDKDQYLQPEEQDTSHLELFQHKSADFTRTMINYIRRQISHGFEVTDAEILERAKLFAHASVDQETITSGLDRNWPQRFKQKHGIGSNKVIPRISQPIIPQSSDIPGSAGRAEGNFCGPSSLSPMEQLSFSSEIKRDEEAQADELGPSFSYNQPGPYSSTYLSSNVQTGTDGIVHTDPQLHSLEDWSSSFSPMNKNYTNQPAQAQVELITPQQQRFAFSFSGLKSSANDDISMLSVDTIMHFPLHRITSASSGTARSTMASVPTSGISKTPVDSSTVPPSQEDARRAAVTVLSYIQQRSPVDANEYNTIVQLIEKLQS